MKITTSVHVIAQGLEKPIATIFSVEKLQEDFQFQNGMSAIEKQIGREILIHGVKAKILNIGLHLYDKEIQGTDSISLDNPDLYALQVLIEVSDEDYFKILQNK